MKKGFVLLVLITLGFGYTQDFPITVTDASGQDVTLEAVPERVICLLPDCIFNMAALDVLPALVHDFDKTSSTVPEVFGERAEEMASFAWGENGPDPELLLDFGADFFVLVEDALEWAPPLATVIEDIPSYNSAGPYVDTTQWDINDPEIWEGFTADLRNFGQILDREAQANAYIERLEDRVAAYTQVVDPSAKYARVRLETDNTIFAPPCMGLFSEMASCVSFGNDWVMTTVEALLAEDPDVIFVEASPDREIDLEAWLDVPLWAELSAVQNGRVFVVPYASFYDTTPLALSNTMDALLPRLNPDVLAGPLTDAQVQKILAN
ncbi:MAG: ABC transporter substrate-binding protein [Deinococcota bacterium]